MTKTMNFLFAATSYLSSNYVDYKEQAQPITNSIQKKSSKINIFPERKYLFRGKFWKNTFPNYIQRSICCDDFSLPQSNALRHFNPINNNWRGFNVNTARDCFLLKTVMTGPTLSGIRHEDWERRRSCPRHWSLTYFHRIELLSAGESPAISQPSSIYLLCGDRSPPFVPLQPRSNRWPGASSFNYDLSFQPPIMHYSNRI